MDVYSTNFAKRRMIDEKYIRKHIVRFLGPHQKYNLQTQQLKKNN